MSEQHADADVDRVCQVCGDKAFARNFGAIACESCKLFFRRALSSRRTPKCNFDNNCIITKINRKCKKCRLGKCYATGMRKELVMIRVNMKKDINSNVNNSPSVSIPEDCSPSSDTTIETMESNECANGFNDCFDFLLQNSDLSDEQIDEEIAEIEKSAISGHNVTESDRQTMAIVRPIATYNKQLNELELNRLTELSRASLSFHIHSDHKSKNIIQVNNIGEYYKMIGLSKMFDNNLEEASKFCKNVEKFNEINETDQLRLFKSASWNLNCLRNLERHSLHDQDDDQWTYTYTGDYCLLYQGNLMKQTVGEANYELFKNFGRSISPEWADDPNLVNLLMIICIFNDALPQLANKNLVKLNQQIYLYLLQRYLTQKYRSDVKSSESLSLIMNSLKILQTTHKLKISLAKQFEQYFSPLVRETFTD